jgi:hypothetical protein
MDTIEEMMNFMDMNVVGVYMNHLFSGWVIEQQVIAGRVVLTVEVDQPFRVFGEQRRFIFVEPEDLTEIA